MPPISQSVDYHQFADQRTYFGTPNFFNVVSNIFIFFSGLAGLILLMRPREFLLNITFIKFSERWPYFILFISVIMASLASTYYHLAPDNARLVWDRFPIAIGIVTLLSTVLIERINTNIGFISLPCLILFGVGSVIYWDWSERVWFGKSKLLYCCAVLFYSSYYLTFKIFFLQIHQRSRYLCSNNSLCFAKLAETLDHEIYSLGQVISGHSVKHLFVGMAVFGSYICYKIAGHYKK